MRTIEILRNGSALCIAGAENASLLTVHLNLFIEEPRLGTLRVSGMNALEGDRSSHTYWLEEEQISPGESLTIRFTDSELAMAPKAEVATDSEQYIAEQEWYEGEVAKDLFEPRKIARNWPGGSLSFCTPGTVPVVATFEGEREFISLSMSWNRWRPDVCRYTLSSFSQAEAVARSGSKEWVEGKFRLEEYCRVCVGA